LHQGTSYFKSLRDKGLIGLVWGRCIEGDTKLNLGAVDSGVYLIKAIDRNGAAKVIRFFKVDGN